MHEHSAAAMALHSLIECIPLDHIVVEHRLLTAGRQLNRTGRPRPAITNTLRANTAIIGMRIVIHAAFPFCTMWDMGGIIMGTSTAL